MAGDAERHAPLDLPPGGRDGGAPVDFGFLAIQTFDDLALQQEVLDLFVAQARRLVPTLPRLDAGARSDVAHLLKGSARGIGAWPTAGAAEAYETAAPAERDAAFARLAAAVAEAETAILAWLADPRRARATI